MLLSLSLALSAVAHADASLILRRVASGGQFGRFSQQEDDAWRLFEEQAGFRMLAMLDNAMSMSLDETMSMSLDETMSLDMAMSSPLDEAMSLDMAMSFPLEDTMSLDFTMSMPPSAEMTPGCDASLSITNVPVDFEVEATTPNEALSSLYAVLSNAVGQEFTLCSSSRKLLAVESVLEESSVRGVKIVRVEESSEETCAFDEVGCFVATTDFDVYHEDAASSDAARAEFLQKLASQLDSVEGVIMLGSSSAEAGSSQGPGEDIGGQDALLTAQTAMIAVLSVAAASIALVAVQRRVSANTINDDKSVVSEETFPNTTYDTAPLNGDGSSLA